jgi:hypothetical protein
MAGTVETAAKEVSPMRRVLAILVAGALLLAASSSALAGWGKGVGGGSDEFVISRPDDVPSGAGNEDVAPLFIPGGKMGVGGGDG